MVRRVMGMVWELSGTQGDGNGMQAGCILVSTLQTHMCQL